MIPEFIYIPGVIPSSNEDDVGYSYEDEIPQSPSSCTCSIFSHRGGAAEAEMADEPERWRATTTERTDASQQQLSTARADDESPKASSRQSSYSQSMSGPKPPQRKDSFRNNSNSNNEDAKTMPPKMPRRVDTLTSLCNLWESNDHDDSSPSNNSGLTNHTSSSHNRQLSLSDEHSSCMLQLPTSNVALVGDIGPIRLSGNMPPRNMDILAGGGRANSASPTGKIDLKKMKEHLSAPSSPTLSLVASPSRKPHPYDATTMTNRESIR